MENTEKTEKIEKTPRSLDLTFGLTEERRQKSLLFDFYGALLTEHQQEIYTMRYNEDCSLAEIATEKDITPQAVVDILKRATARLNTFEEKLGMIERHKSQLTLLVQLSSALDDLEDPAFIEVAQALGSIRDAYEKLKLL